VRRAPPPAASKAFIHRSAGRHAAGITAEDPPPFRRKPQLLEKLGILRRNGKTPAQRGAATKAAATRKANKAQAAQTAPAPGGKS
jgi:hypothetical protein